VQGLDRASLLHHGASSHLNRDSPSVDQQLMLSALLLFALRRIREHAYQRKERKP